MTLVRNRNAMLAGLVAGLSRNGGADAELVVVRAGGEDPTGVVDRCPLPAAVVEVDAPHDAIPYSVARNTGAGAASGDLLCFMDADCIPSAGFAPAMIAALEAHDALCTTDVRYLPPGPLPGDEAELWASSRPHPARPRPPADGVELGSPHALVWGLCMAMRRATFERAGRFDEAFGGYAGEDTDLGRTLCELGVPVGLVGGAAVFHQHHDVFEPPIHQMEATLSNARRYREKWGQWPMGGWLQSMRDLGLIDWSPDAAELRVLRQPTEAEVASARRTTARAFRRT